MSIPLADRGITPDAWVAALAGMSELIEVVDGEFVIKRVGGNPHHYIARRLAQEFERQWPDVVATAPGNWALTTSSDGKVVLGRVPDVLVDGAGLLEAEVFTGVPEAAVEVWSPGNTLAEMNTKRAEYRTAGLPVLCEAFLTEAQEVHLEWLVNDDGRRWSSIVVAVGEQQLSVTTPRPFSVAPNALLRRTS